MWLEAQMIWPERVVLGNQGAFANYLQRLRRAHNWIYHDPRKLTCPPP